MDFAALMRGRLGEEGLRLDRSRSLPSRGGRDAVTRLRVCSSIFGTRLQTSPLRSKHCGRGGRRRIRRGYGPMPRVGQSSSVPCLGGLAALSVAVGTGRAPRPQGDKPCQDRVPTRRARASERRRGVCSFDRSSVTKGEIETSKVTEIVHDMFHGADPPLSPGDFTRRPPASGGPRNGRVHRQAGPTTGGNPRPPTRRRRSRWHGCDAR